MIGGRRVIALIPARAGSKSVRDKNIHQLRGKPLIAWSIEAAQAVPQIDRVIVSTDGSEIADIARQLGVEVYDRPAELAGDTALVIDTIRHLYSQLQNEGEAADIMLLLECTSPLRSPQDIVNCLNLMVDENLDSVATFKEADLNPHRAWTIADGHPAPFIAGAIPWRPRQELPGAWQLNGAVYGFRPELLPSTGSAVLFGKMGAILMPKERSVDIDEAVDFVIADALLRMNQHAHA